MHLMSGTPWETVTLTTLSRDRNLFPLLLSEARDLAMIGQEGKLVIHTAWGIEWKPFGLPRRKRPLQSVVLAPDISEKIEHDLQTLLRRRQWYADRGMKPSCSITLFPLTISFARHPVSARLLAARTTRIRENFLHPGSGRLLVL